MPEKTEDRPGKKTKRVRNIPSPYQKNCVSMSPSQFLKFLLDIDTTDWEIENIDGGVENDVKVSHVTLDYIGVPGVCPECGTRLAVHDRRERVWRHANLDNTVCYLHARVPRCRCPKCGKLAQVDLPWADPNVSYTKRFMEVAIEHMSQMSLLAASRILMTTWRVLDGIVETAVRKHLDSMDLSGLRRIRVDETSAKKNHRYITVITDADTDDIVFITKGRDSTVMKEFRDWVLAHNGDPSEIELVATDFGSSFMLGVSLFFPNAETVLDPFHLVQIANRALDRDRISCQVNGQRLKSIRYSLLKGKENLNDGERAVIMDFTKDNEKVALSYQMKESLRDILRYAPEEADLAHAHLTSFARWAKEKGSCWFRKLGKTVEKNLDGIVRAIRTGMNNGFQEGLNGRIQMSKRLARGYRRESRFGRIIYFRDAYRTY